MALVKQHNDILTFLLDNYHQYWPKNLFDDWFKERLFKNDLFTQEHILEVIRIFFRSKTCKSIFGSLTARKQKEWIFELVNEIESTFVRKDLPRETAIKSVTLQELTNQPYCGSFLMYQLFEESSSADELLIKKSLKNCTDFDFI